MIMKNDSRVIGYGIMCVTRCQSTSGNIILAEIELTRAADGYT